jgi:hypothetical protein
VRLRSGVELRLELSKRAISSETEPLLFRRGCCCSPASAATEGLVAAAVEGLVAVERFSQLR